MKKISLLFGCLFLFISCASTQWAINGDVTAYNADGTVLRQWDNVVIESGFTDTMIGTHTTTNAIKSFGINFIDPKTHKNIIISNAVPCIIEYSSKEYEEYLPNANRVIDLDSNISNKTNISNSTSHNESLIKTFNSDKIHKLSREQQRELAKDFVSEINYDIKNAASEQDMLLIKEKIEVLIKFNNSLPKKNYLIIDALSSIQYEYKQKAKKLGINL